MKYMLYIVFKLTSLIVNLSKGFSRDKSLIGSSIRQGNTRKHGVCGKTKATGQRQ